MTRKAGPETPAEKEMRERDLPARDVRGEDQMPVEQSGGRHPRTEGKGGMPDDIGDATVKDEDEDE